MPAAATSSKGQGVLISRTALSSLIVSYFFVFLLFWAPLCLVVGVNKYFFGALYNNGDVVVPSRPESVYYIYVAGL